MELILTNFTVPRILPPFPPILEPLPPLSHLWRAHSTTLERTRTMSEAFQPFEADVARVLDLVINSLYKDKDIFLRELVSNASDACDKLRYQSLSRPELLGTDPELRIEILLDEKAGVLTVRDNGIGMDRDDLVANLGTIARSGTARFLEAMGGGEHKNLKLIGQFGVGFYAAFMVADRVVVLSRKAGDDTGWAWASDGRSGFSVSEAETAVPRGTSVVLHLKDEAKADLSPAKIEATVRRYSDHVALPILLGVKPEAGAEEKEAEAPRQVNRASALWARPKAEITEEQYKEFYHHAAHAWDEPFARVHFAAEGALSYTALLFVPTERPFDLFDPKRRHGVKLYVRKVFISDEVEGLLPRYLRFVSGVVDSEDLQLNVSRETLQHGAVVARMKKAIVRRLLDELARKAKAAPEAEAKEGEDADPSYERFWESFGVVLKEGLYEDAENRPKLLELARFRSTHGPGWVSLADYAARMKEGQDAVLYISGESAEALRTSPHLEAARAKGVEVLLLDDPVDDFWLGEVRDYEGKPFRSLTKGSVDLSKVVDGAAKPEEERADQTGLDALIARLKAALGDEVKDVRPSSRLRESAVCLVAEEAGIDLRMERFLRQHGQFEQLSRRILEVNPAHPLIREMAQKPDDAALDDLAHLLLDQARIIEGEAIPDPGAFSRRMSAWLAKGI